MFELPECITLAAQMTREIRGKRLAGGSLGNSPHKFVWYNRSHEEFARLVEGKEVGAATARGRWIFLPLVPGHVLLLGECGGKLLYHPAGTDGPSKFHLRLVFTDSSSLTVTTQMWGAMELYETGKELEREYVRGMRITPAETEFTFEYFQALLDSLLGGQRRSVKGLLTQEQLIPGLGNSIAQDIMFRARLHPKRAISELDGRQRLDLYRSIVDTVREVIARGGRNDELDLYGKPGGYTRIMDKNALSRPCPTCGHSIEKISYLGGACYFCPACQQ